ncbi:MAG TPA: patatin-like phospholipase family protein [Burkholderiaceae bacterium]|nr:patatin-like phospholipase family protein [Burkholderiaceae bacterium]
MSSVGVGSSDAMTVLVLQGGGALGAYQAGAFEALAAQGREPGWVAGISIGAINGALVAGNPPERRVERLRTFWDLVTGGMPSMPLAIAAGPLRAWANDWSAAWGATVGLPGFFMPRPVAEFWPSGGGGPSYYDTAPLHATLTELVDFDLLNDGATRLSVGAVDVETGNFAYFDNRTTRIGPEHVMASGALPPGFPPVPIDGRWYWDGGLVSNTPLRPVLEATAGGEVTIFQVDLYSARGPLPQTMAQVAEREKDIRYSSRTRAVTDMLRERHEAHRRLQAVAAMLPADRRADPQVQRWLAEAKEASITLVHLIRRRLDGETETKDYEFSRTSMLDHWQAGARDMAHALAALGPVTRKSAPGEFRVFDFGLPTQKPKARGPRRDSEADMDGCNDPC